MSKNDENIGKPKALILDPQEKVRGYVEKILTLAGWNAVTVGDCSESLKILNKDVASPFALFIGNYDYCLFQDPKLLKKVKKFSPMTQRVILVPESRSHDLSHVVNQIGIRACISIPFAPKILVQHAKACLFYFSKLTKRSRMQRIIAHQNRQLYGAAKKMQEKEESLALAIQKRKFQKQVLHRVEESGQCSLKERLIYYNIPSTIKNLEKERAGIEDEIFGLFEQAAKKMDLSLPQKTDESGPSGKTDFDEQFLNMIQRIVKIAFGSVPDLRRKPEDVGEEIITPIPQEIFEEDNEPQLLDSFFDICISNDQLMAFIEKTGEIPSSKEEISVSNVLDFLRVKGITHGIVPDTTIEKWLENAKPNEPLQVAQGSPATMGRDGKVTYHFENMTIDAGKIKEDGSIDFKERSNIPHVAEGDLLAEKIPPVEGVEGITVGGIPITVTDTIDPGFSVKSNAYFSEDGLSIFSSIDGQPHVDPLGEISVSPEMVIDGDVGYETGNITFDGNVVVRGSIQGGFSVKCINLVVEGIEEAEVDITGDLTAEAGITESKITAVGHVQAKFINKSFVSTFGDIVVQKEILDSEILLGGTCNNATGHIIASSIVARNGVEAGKVGTDTSTPCVISVGANDLADHAREKLKQKIQKIQAKYQSIGRSIDELGAKDQELYPIIIKKTQHQESLADFVGQAKEKLARKDALQDSQDMSREAQEIRKFEKQQAIVEKELDQLFGFQDTYVKNIEQLQETYDSLKEEEQKVFTQLQEIDRFEKNSPRMAELVVHKVITRKTTINGMYSSLVVGQKESNCKIREVRQKDARSGKLFAHMVISDLSDS